MARSLFYGMSRYGPGLERKQMFLGRIVDIGAELYAIVAACVYAQMLAVEKRREDAIELADLFGRQARLRIDHLFTDLWRNEDTRNYDAAQRMLLGRYAWLEEGLIEAWRSDGSADRSSEEEPVRRAG
jgi:hypothetical protein